MDCNWARGQKLVCIDDEWSDVHLLPVNGFPRVDQIVTVDVVQMTPWWLGVILVEFQADRRIWCVENFRPLAEDFDWRRMVRREPMKLLERLNAS